VSFSVFGIAFIFTVGGIIIALSVVLDPLMDFLRKRWGIKQYQQLEWVTNDTLQLQRLAHEEISIGTWSNATRPVPITQMGEKLALLDLSDPTHPKLLPTEETSGVSEAKTGMVDSVTVVDEATTPVETLPPGQERSPSSPAETHSPVQALQGGVGGQTLAMRVTTNGTSNGTSITAASPVERETSTHSNQD
jgi:hypothetical protein